MDLDLTALPASLQEIALARWRDILQRAQEQGVDVAPLACHPQWPRVLAGSDFVARSALAAPAVVVSLVTEGELSRDKDLESYRSLLAPLVEAAADESELAVVLRRFRRREMVRIAWRELGGAVPEEVVLAELSALAEACIDLGLARLTGWQAGQWGQPLDAEGRPLSLVVLGMGKLGGGELNFSSDVDLIFAYREEGEVSGPAGARSHGEFFIRLAQRLVNLLHQTTAEGFVFRVDTRLRPFGDAGRLVLSFDAMEDYYQTHGREWERYALIKARAVGGDRGEGAELLRRLRPFVYRRYLDYGAIAALREMKALIEREARRRGREGDVKLGPGGIREIEFITQVFQLIRGGRDPELQGASLLPVLERLGAKGLLPPEQVAELKRHYLFLRRVENRIQAQDDRQTHRLPEDSLAQTRLALAFGKEWAALEAQIREVMSRVRGQFEQVFRAPQTESRDSRGEALRALWSGGLDPEEGRRLLMDLGFARPVDLIEALEALREGPRVRTLSNRGRERLDALMPLLLAAVGGQEEPDAVWPRLLRLVEAILGRTPYLDLLVENPLALSQLVRLCAASPWVAEELAAHPLLLDELVDPRTLREPLEAPALRAELERVLAPVADDLEQAMERLRQFKRAQVLRVAAADLLGHAPLPRVSDYLTAIAETVLQAALDLAWRHLGARHGEPRCRVDGQWCRPGFAVIGYGKLGGIELGYGSDLDLVFLHDSRGEAQQTTGPRSIDNAVFFARLAQRLMHILTAFTPAGRLYEVDTRLRPSGSAGVLVSSLEAFGRYQRESAWTWEHQALVRARAVAGDEGVGAAFRRLRAEVLGRQRDPRALAREIIEMRARMRENLSHDDAEHFDIKQGRGGLVDIEFLVQYAVLRWSHDHPALLEWTDNLRLLETLAAEGLWPEAVSRELAEIYQRYRSRLHRLTLQRRPPWVVAEEFASEREVVRRWWREVLSSTH